MAKRSATRELTDRNWDEDDEPEEAGKFAMASSDVMKTREIRKVKRRNPDGDSAGGGAFTGFSGFSFKPMTASTPFSLNVKSQTNGKLEGTSTETKTIGSATSAFSGMGSSAVSKLSNKNNSGAVNGEENKQTSSSSAYLQNLKSLNQCLLSWTKKHVDQNPYCILTPIFKDYEKHLAELDKDAKLESKSAGSKKLETIQESNHDSTDNDPTSISETTTSKKDSTGSLDSTGSSTKATPAAASFTFSTASSSTLSDIAKPAITAGFNFKSSLGDSKAGFSFATGISQATESKGSASQDEEDEYVPPKPEVAEIVEDDALYSKKCKLFYQKDGTWTERGVGHLHLKSLNDKVQLVVRADTNLGNILLNIMLTDSIPLKKQGKNNVSLVCIPNPPINPKADPTTPVPMLIRVKTEQDAEDLLKKMNELKS